MLKEFLNIWPAIKSVISLSNSELFKKNKNFLLLKDNDILYFRNCFKIFSIFVKATTKLQAEKYPTIYYLIPEIYKIYTQLENVQAQLNVSISFNIYYKFNTNNKLGREFY
jgi:hypothetical protein